ncbi:MAG: hypothetical protein GY740_23955, partial [Gammaproteobacteria bacterium]|nr:hypothetical protein [Gammaproteobacteria bacterium]
FPSFIDIGHGYHLVMNPMLVFNWAEQHNMPIQAVNWEEQFISQNGEAPRRRHWRQAGANIQQVQCTSPNPQRLSNNLRDMIGKEHGDEAVEEWEQFYKAGYNWMVSLYRYDRLMCGNGKTLWQVKSHGIACAEGFINYRKWRHTIWKKLPSDSWKMGHCTTFSLIGPEEGKLEGMTREDWNAMKGNKRNVFGDSLPRECKPPSVQRNERLEEYYANNPQGQHETADDLPFDDDDDDDVDDGEADETVNDAIPPIVEKPKSKSTKKTSTNGNNKPKEQARRTKGRQS